MTSLPSRPDLGQLKRQAKELLAGYRNGDAEAVARFAAALPAARHTPDIALREMAFRLHDAQSCLAREYGFASWADLRGYVEVVARLGTDPDAMTDSFLGTVYAGEIAGGNSRARPATAARLLAEHGDQIADDPLIACATGDVEAVRRQIEAEPGWIDRAGGRLNLTPLIAACQSSLVLLPEYHTGLVRTVAALLEAGADPNRRLSRSWQVNADMPADTWEVSALHGAAGVYFDPEITRLLIAAGADPNDGESLYHSLDNPVCTPLLLEAGAWVEGTNALFRALDFDDLDTFQRLVDHAGDSNELRNGRLILWAIRRRRSPAHIRALLAAGADPKVKNKAGVSAHVAALRYGLPEVADLLAEAGGATPSTIEDRFVAACARADADMAQEILNERPGLPASLDQDRLRLLPELAEAGARDAVKLMVDLGWPLDVKGGDWNASALNQAVFRGDAELARYLLERGSVWTERHGFGDNVCGTLSWASVNEPHAEGDWPGCASALLDHGMPGATRDPEMPGAVLVGGERRRFSDAVTDTLLGADR
ncbi:ankyrin repeat domain-containing protein [Maritimibacter dapengensis]|uniref:Ankyrin repeat-containing protein n=1 Tax=Maritimibacter dapengensis TaxID=2836868 RepID=A0ABS6T690_9RHOB|nr:ankyrin repeat domain-containing protein [Maritimibacter dapengensis]MBV7380781.1 hypothetical protein [Maritimibacter dapengensis]